MFSLSFVGGVHIRKRFGPGGPNPLGHRQNLLASDYEIYMICLLVVTVYWHKSVPLVKESNITLLHCLSRILLGVRFDYHITPGYYSLTAAQVLRCVFPSSIYITS